MMTSSTTPLGRVAAAALPLLLLAACATVPARPSVINTSRLGLAKAPGVAARGVVQLEAGYSRAQQPTRTRHTLGEAVVRVGLGGNTEARIGVPSYQRVVTAAARTEGAADASFALKHRLRTAAGWRPALALVAGTSLPTGSRGMGAGELQPELGMSAEWALVQGLRALAMGLHREAVAASDRYGQNTLAAALRFPVARPAMAQLEYGRVMTTRAGSHPSNQLRAGAAVRLTPTLQVDGWLGRATSAGTADTQFGIGFAQTW